jgi:enoyl-CoA hydratase/carnithine racemase
MIQNTTAPTVLVADIPASDGGTLRLIQLNRPEKLNCLSLSMLDQLLAAVAGSDGASCVALTGAGRSFCAGLDLKEIGGASGVTPAGVRQHIQKLVEIYRWFLSSRIPTVVFASGYAVGGGAGLVASAQTAIVSGGFRFKLPDGNLAPFASVALPLFNLRAESKAGAKEWLGHEYDAQEACQLGLVDHVLAAAGFNELLCQFKKGDWRSLPPAPKPRQAPALTQAIQKLDEFLQAL